MRFEATRRISANFSYDRAKKIGPYVTTTLSEIYTVASQMQCCSGIGRQYYALDVSSLLCCVQIKRWGGSYVKTQLSLYLFY